MNSREREVSKIYHSSWILSILVFIIDAKINYDPTKVWKRVWILEPSSENGCGKWNILVWNWVRIWGTGWHTPIKNSEVYSPPPPGRNPKSTLSRKTHSIVHGDNKIKLLDVEGHKGYLWEEKVKSYLFCHLTNHRYPKLYERYCPWLLRECCNYLSVTAKL